MRLKTLIRLWLWMTLMAVAAFIVLAVIERGLKAQTGFGVVDLQMARIHRDVAMRDAELLTDRCLVAPPAIIRIGPAQIDQRLDAMAGQEGAEKSGPGLCRARRLAGDDPVEIVENVAGAAHGGCVAAHAIHRKPEGETVRCA